MHKWWDYGEGYRTDVVLPSKKRPDAVNFEKRHIIELKPNNARKIREGTKQVERYRQEAEKVFGGGVWTAEVKTYD